jgi:predicted CoA-binding protein
MKDLINSFLLNKKIAVVGSFKHEEKYAYVILRELVRQGYEVYPVNPNAGSVDGLACFTSVSELPDEVLAVDIVTPPGITRTIVEECVGKNIRFVWLQPGSESTETIEYCSANNIRAIYDACILTSLAE